MVPTMRKCIIIKANMEEICVEIFLILAIFLEIYPSVMTGKSELLGLLKTCFY
jgi:hypothetical protein